MSSKTKIIVLHMKELIYTGIFAVLGILLVVLLVIMFLPEDGSSDLPADDPSLTLPEETGETESTEETEETPDAVTTSTGGTYIPGIYTTQLVLNDQAIDVEVIVDSESISSIRLVNLNEAVTTMYPLLEPTFDSLCEQIYEKQSVDNISYETDSKYTSLVLLEAIRSSLAKAYAGDTTP